MTEEVGYSSALTENESLLADARRVTLGAIFLPVETVEMDVDGIMRMVPVDLVDQMK